MFIIKKDNKVILADNNKKRLETTLKYKPELQGLQIEETTDDWQIVNGEYRLGGLTTEEQNEAIRQTRESLYRSTSDYLKADYDEAVARGAENTEELKKAWLESKDKIREENPYIGGDKDGL